MEASTIKRSTEETSEAVERAVLAVNKINLTLNEKLKSIRAKSVHHIKAEKAEAKMLIKSVCNTENLKVEYVTRVAEGGSKTKK